MRKEVQGLRKEVQGLIFVAIIMAIFISYMQVINIASSAYYKGYSAGYDAGWTKSALAARGLSNVTGVSCNASITSGRLIITIKPYNSAGQTFMRQDVEIVLPGYPDQKLYSSQRAPDYLTLVPLMGQQASSVPSTVSDSTFQQIFAYFLSIQNGTSTGINFVHQGNVTSISGLDSRSQDRSGNVVHIANFSFVFDATPNRQVVTMTAGEIGVLAGDKSQAYVVNLKDLSLKWVQLP